MLDRIRRRRIVLALAIAAVLLLLGEAAIAWILDHPAQLPAGDGRLAVIPQFFRRYHIDFDRKIIQYLPGCGRYDHALFYGLQPGSCLIQNREFAVRYDVNSHGLRDDEASFADPTIVVLGDSLGMGWGVEHREVFSERLEARLGVPVLNAAVSSYGTARELALLRRLDRRRAPMLVIQYSDNDYQENRAYLENGGRLRSSPESRYREAARLHAESVRYYPGKHTLNVARLLGSSFTGNVRFRPAPRPLEAKRAEARALLDTLGHNLDLLRGKLVVVIEIDCVGAGDRGVINAAREMVSAPAYAELASIVSFVDASPRLSSSQYFRLDDHINAAGHAVVADLLEAELGRRAAMKR